MNIRINFDYYDQILNLYGRIISKKQKSHNQTNVNECSSNSLSKYVNIYVKNSITTLKRVIQLALSSNNENLAYAALEVFNYLTLPNDVIYDYNRNYQGYFDNAWLIHNFAKYCVGKGYFPESAFEDNIIDNTKIDTYLSKDISKDIYLKLHKTLNKVIKEYQI